MFLNHIHKLVFTVMRGKPALTLTRDLQTMTPFKRLLVQTLWALVQLVLNYEIGSHSWNNNPKDRGYK